MNTWKLSGRLMLAAAMPFIGGQSAFAQAPDSLRVLSDRAEIEELVARYVHALDTLDADSYAQTVRAAENGQFIVGFMGRNDDVIVKRDGRWQILNRKLVSFVR
jgi:hypothetical protein